MSFDSASGSSALRAAVRALAAELRPCGVFCAADGLDGGRGSVPEREVSADGSDGSADGGIEWLLRPIRGGGAQGGVLSEWIAEGEGTGVASVVFAVLRALKPTGGVVLVDGGRLLLPSAMGFPVAMGGRDGDDVVLVRVESDRERRWAIEQALRCRCAGAVVAWVERASERFLRRLQLAAEAGGGWGFLIRPPGVRKEKCWGNARFLVRPRPSERSDRESGRRRVEIEVHGGRGGIAIAGQAAVAELCDATGAVCLVSAMADPAAACRAAGA